MRIPDEIKREILDYGKRNIAEIIGDYLPLVQKGKVTPAAARSTERRPLLSMSHRNVAPGTASAAARKAVTSPSSS